jgi:hypothetical protein
MAGTSQDKPGHDDESDAESEPGLVLVPMLGEAATRYALNRKIKRCRLRKD